MIHKLLNAYQVLIMSCTYLVALHQTGYEQYMNYTDKHEIAPV